MKSTDLFKDIYLKSIISESTNSENKKQKVKEITPPIDNLTDENITTIEETSENISQESLDKQIETEADDNNEFMNEDEFEDSGWGEKIEEILDPVIKQGENLFYEIKNCVRGSFTNCKTREELANYLNNYAQQIIEISESL